MNTELLQKYATIKVQIAALEEQEAALKLEVQKHLEEQKLEKYSSEFGTFSVVARASYTYSDAVEKANKELKELKKKEENDMTAKKETTYSLRFQA